MKALILAAMAVVMLMAVEAGASDKDGHYRTYSQSCPKYLESRQEPKGTVNRESAHDWVSGYLTAANLFGDDTYDILGGSEREAALFWLENWCRANPFKGIANGMEAFFHERHPHRLKTAPK